MKTQNFKYEDVLNLLFKKASGLHYIEEQFEYEKTQKVKLSNEKTSHNFNTIKNNDMVNTQTSMFDDTIKPINENKESENLTLVKKKITTHYIPPDMLAIKTLLEIYGKEIDENNLSNISDEELIKLKNKLIGEILNENK